MPCSWCGSHAGVRQVKRNGQAVRSPLPGVPLHLCYRCWGVYTEEGRRRDQTGRPGDARGRTIPMTVPILRQIGRR